MPLPEAKDHEQFKTVFAAATMHARAQAGFAADIRIVDAQSGIAIASPNGAERYARIWIDAQGLAHWEPTPATPEILRCRQCGERAVAVFAFNEGCAVYPDDREQALCWHHAKKATPLDSMELVRDLTSGSFGEWWRS